MLVVPFTPPGGWRPVVRRERPAPLPPLAPSGAKGAKGVGPSGPPAEVIPLGLLPPSQGRPGTEGGAPGGCGYNSAGAPLGIPAPAESHLFRSNVAPNRARLHCTVPLLPNSPQRPLMARYSGEADTMTPQEDGGRPGFPHRRLSLGNRGTSWPRQCGGDAWPAGRERNPQSHTLLRHESASRDVAKGLPPGAA